jgi:hypothetical protein
MSSITVLHRVATRDFFTLTLKSNSNVSPFLQLPVELRYEIYGVCFSEEVYSFIDAGCKFKISTGSHGYHERGRKLPKWLLTNRQILREGTQYFFEKSVCRIWSKAHRADMAKGQASILSLTRVHSLQLTTGLSIITVDKSDKKPLAQAAIIFHPHSTYTAYLSSLTKFSAIHMLHLRVLKLRINMPYSYSFHRLRYRNILKSSKVDITTLSRLGPGLRRVEFIIPEPQVDSTSEDEVLFAEIAYIAVQTELENVAKRLVSHEGRLSGYIAKDWLEEKTLRGHQVLDGNEAAVGYDWHLDVSSAEGVSKASIRHKGMSSWEDISGKDARFHSRKELPNGQIEWYSATHRKIAIVVANSALGRASCTLPLHIQI